MCYIKIKYWRRILEDKDKLIFDMILKCFLFQDLLKYIFYYYYDRLFFQIVFIDLENVIYMFNERKREFEEFFQFKKFQKTFNFKIFGEKQCRFVRQDDMEEVVRV